ncbi:1,4-alpha-glucan branching protein GlgB [Mesoflavibacter profundi]|uniref:1,4-alpha-glucan branching protein GlgB n=1 Tax=Mesoflavibacter profundi TaxID=2708110 RepID=UPI00351965C3
MSQVQPHSLFTDLDIYLFKNGTHYKLYEKFGSHVITLNGVEGTYFAVWAPSAKQVSVVGDFNYWEDGLHTLNVRWDESGIWEGFIPNIKAGEKYKYKIHSTIDDQVTEKADPFAKQSELPPKTASIVSQSHYKWQDKPWMLKRKKANALDAPFSIYEVHLGSWRRHIEDNSYLSYSELAYQLVNYVKELNFTHVQFMPIMEYPYDPSWGYQITGYFSATSRFGSPEELKFLIDKFHENNIGVILDWVPSHFPEDKHGLGNFDGSHLYEHPDPKKGYHPDWKSLIFNYGRNEVKSFLISNALFWLDQFHVDGLRVDAVASMLYLDYSRNEGEWNPNQFGGRENLEAIQFIKELNQAIYKAFPDVQTIAEESTAFPGVSKPVFLGGLGFGMKWMMGWMHDTLQYFSKAPIYRKHHQKEITFSLTYAFTENFTLPLSHDEVVYGKKSLVSKMPGDDWQKFANLRLLYSYMYTHPGAKLLFQGGEFAQHDEWNYSKSLDWHLTQFNSHKGMQKIIADLNTLYKQEKALHELQFDAKGFEWIDYNDAENSVISYIRKGKSNKDSLIVICNMTPVPRLDYRLGVPKKGVLKQLFNSDEKIYDGTGNYSNLTIKTQSKSWHYKKESVQINLPPLAVLVFNYQ